MFTCHAFYSLDVCVPGYFQTIQGISPGNMGQLDQVMALQWVQENIHVFGGDPRQVTLAGDCAGGASALYHMMSPLSQGQFIFTLIIAPYWFTMVDIGFRFM